MKKEFILDIPDNTGNMRRFMNIAQVLTEDSSFVRTFLIYAEGM